MSENKSQHSGAIAWMTRNSVAANLVFAFLIIGGLVFTSKVRQEVFPEFSLDIVTITVPYPGASPEEVEKGVVLAVEEAISGIEGIKTITGEASENAGVVYFDLERGTDVDRAVSDVKNAVDAIRTFPQDAEEPTVSIIQSKREVLSVVVYGQQTIQTLQAVGEKIRDSLSQKKEISQVDTMGIPPLEMAIEVPRERLEQYGLTLEMLAGIISRSSVEIPAGGLKTSKGEILLRTSNRRQSAEAYGNIVVLNRPDGGRVLLRDLAIIKDGYAETEEQATFNNQPAIMLKVFRPRNSSPIESSAATLSVLKELEADIPEGVSYSIWNDSSEIYKDRIDLLLRNALMGLVLVFIILGLLLEPGLAFWVTMGIPTSFLGAFLLIPGFDISINMISLFAFIVSLGLVVDDAIVVGENIYQYREKGLGHLEAAIQGAKDIAAPVTFSVLTSCAAFSPMFFVPGISGKFFMNIPAIVVAVLAISLIESVFVLPAHLSHGDGPKKKGMLGRFLESNKATLPVAKSILKLQDWSGQSLTKIQQPFQKALQVSIDRYYDPIVRLAINRPFYVFAVCIFLFLSTIGLIAGGRIPFTFLPNIEGDVVFVNARLPIGTPIEESHKVVDRLMRSAEKTLKEKGNGKDVSRGLLGMIGAQGTQAGPVAVGGSNLGAHVMNMQLFLVPVDQRDFTAEEFVERWRENVGALPQLETLTFKASLGPSVGKPITIQLSHVDTTVLNQAADAVAEQLKKYPYVIDIDNGRSLGKEQFDFKLTEEGRKVGLNEGMLGMMLRNSFYGIEAEKQQRGRLEMKTVVRFPKDQRSLTYTLENMKIALPNGALVPLSAVATIEKGRAYSRILRTNGRRVAEVTGDLVSGKGNSGAVLRDMKTNVLPEIMSQFPGLSFSFEGETKDQQESLSELGKGYILALVIIFALLAIPFRSYTQPFVIMAAIPFGLVGAVWGHVLLGYGLSLISIMGIVALSGVVVNDSLVLVDSVNKSRAKGISLEDALVMAGKKRFRPIILTSLTTFFGLAPMIFETSMQARFLVPMAISLGFGVMFTTFVILVLVPVLYAILQKITGQGDPKNEVRTQSTAAAPSNTDHEQTELAAARELLETT